MGPQENKSYYFSLRINFIDNSYDLRETIDTSMDIILKVLSAMSQCFAFSSKNNLALTYFFKTDDRRRASQIRKTLDNNLPVHVINDYELLANTKHAFYESAKKFDLNLKWIKYRSPADELDYDGTDLELFENPKNWFDWQKKLYNKIFYDNGDIREPDDRKIIAIVDEHGNKGKSKFIKYLCVNNLNRISKISFGTSTQLRSSLIAGGQKDVFLIDFTRARGRSDSVDDVLATVEDLKGGFLTSGMYGRNKTLMQKPPTIVIFTNKHLPYNQLSTDRWDPYTITQSSTPPYRLNKMSLTKYYAGLKIKK
jgi:hypothetical protein